MTADQTDGRDFSGESFQGKGSYNVWKMKELGVGQRFPYTQPLTPEDYKGGIESRFYLGDSYEEAMGRVLVSLSQPLTAGVFTRGHGVTTMSEYVFQDATKFKVRTRTIPVRMTFDQIQTMEAGPVPSSDAFADLLRTGMVKQLVSGNWQATTGSAIYANLIGASKTSDIPQAQIALRSVVDQPEIDWSQVGDLAPQLMESPVDILRKLNDAGVLTSLQFDLSTPLAESDPDQWEGVLRSFNTTMKRFHEDPKNTDVVTEGLGEVYFTDQQTLDTLGSSWDRGYDIVEFPQLAPMEIQGIIRKHYPSRALYAAGVREPLLTVMEEELLRKGCARPIKDIIGGIDRNLLQYFSNQTRK